LHLTRASIAGKHGFEVKTNKNTHISRSLKGYEWPGKGRMLFVIYLLEEFLISLIGWDYKCWRIARRM
jgi:hypothetical protein